MPVSLQIGIFIKGQQTLSATSQVVNTLSYIGHVIFVVFTQSGPYSIKATLNNM